MRCAQSPGVKALGQQEVVKSHCGRCGGKTWVALETEDTGDARDMRYLQDKLYTRRRISLSEMHMFQQQSWRGGPSKALEVRSQVLCMELQNLMLTLSAFCLA